MKKIFVFILLIITAAGTFIPCCQSDNCCDEQIANNDGHEKNKSEAACSPFFACATCPGSIVVSKPIQFIHPVAEKQVHQDRIEVYNPSAYLNAYWQPPRFC